MWKQQAKTNLKYETNKGLLTGNQLWSLSIDDLADAIRDTKALMKKSNDDDLSFLQSDDKSDPEMELRFNILKDVYITKQQDAKELREAAEKRIRNQKILHKIAIKQDSMLDNMTIEELENQLE